MNVNIRIRRRPYPPIGYRMMVLNVNYGNMEENQRRIIHDVFAGVVVGACFGALIMAVFIGGRQG